MYKNQLQELAQRSCFNLPSYSCIREGPDHGPRFKATVNFNGEIFESPTFCSTLRQAEHAAAEVALNVLSKKGPSKALAARVLDETGVYKNLLQETAHRAGLKLPVYTTVRSGPGHVPVFSCTVELAGMSYTGESAKTKKQAQKNTALMAWSALKKQAKSASSASSFSSSPSPELGTNDEQDQVIMARYLATLKPLEMYNSQRREKRTSGGSAPIRWDVIPFARSVNLFQHQNWRCSQFYPELSLYQTCAQEGVFRHRDHLLALSSVPFSPPTPRPQTSPFIQSMLQSDHGYYYPSQGQEPMSIIPEFGPFLYFSNHVMPVPVTSVSQLTLREIEENQQMEEWCKGDGDSNCWNNNSPSNVPRLSLTETPNSSISFNNHSEERMQERLREQDEEKSSSSVPNAGESIQWQCSQLKQRNQVSPGLKYAGPGRRATTTDGAKFHLQNPDPLDYLQSSFRPPNPTVVSSSGSVRGFVPASYAAPFTARTSAAVSTGSLRPESSNPLAWAPRPTRIAPPSCSSHPRSEVMKRQGGMPSRQFMAPAVNIRSVMPVCSAPPTKKFPSPSREGLLSEIENKRTGEPGGDLSAASSDFSKLRL